MPGFYIEGFAACKFNSDCLLHEFLISRGTSSLKSNESQNLNKIPEDTPSSASVKRRYAIDVNRLFANAKFLDDVFITLGIVCFQIVQQAAALANHHQKTSPGG